MKLCIDIGNSTICAAIYAGDNLVARAHHAHTSAIPFEAFLNQELGKHKISKAGICSVVPELEESAKEACLKYCNVEPIFFDIHKQNLVNVRLTSTAGADRVACAAAAAQLFPNKNLVIVDFGTATTVSQVTKNKDYLSIAILPGMQTSAKALNAFTSKLPLIEVMKPNLHDVMSTKLNIEIGIYYAQIGAIKEIAALIKRKFLETDDALIIGTGGFSHLFEREKLFDHTVPDLVLLGIKYALESP